jgi:hypothetical protein
MLRIGQMGRTFVTELREELIFELFVIFLLAYYYELIGITKNTSSTHTKEIAIFSMGLKHGNSV